MKILGFDLYMPASLDGKAAALLSGPKGLTAAVFDGGAWKPADFAEVSVYGKRLSMPAFESLIKRSNTA